MPSAQRIDRTFSPTLSRNAPRTVSRNPPLAVMNPPPAADFERRHLRAPSPHRLATSQVPDRMVALQRLDPTTAEVVGQTLGAQTNCPVWVAASSWPTR